MTFAYRMGYVSRHRAIFLAEGFVGPLFTVKFGRLLWLKGPNEMIKNRVARISHGVQSHVLQYAEMKVCIARIPVKKEKQSPNFFWR